ncbi:MAG: adenosine kinase [Desulfobacteraceae bacterium]|jgi:sugar/nucleoside kinase (ribokinase family)|nr:adenosine kinase [Desulfobacteraceae bacterium]
MAEINIIKNDRQLIAGIGSALVDILIHEDDDFIEKTGAAKGGMTLVDNSWIERTLALGSARATIVAGGSACNTIVGVGQLGGKARFVGKCGTDKWGRQYENDLGKQNVDAAILRSDSPTGRVLSIITPDAQRTMFTYLGASSETRPEEITAGSFADAAVVHVEGYLLFNPDLIQAALDAAKEAGALVSLDLASFTVVEQSLDLLDKLVVDSVDILIANEDEARAFTGQSDEKLALRALSQKANVAVLKVGPRGSHITHAGEFIHIQPLGDGTALDTTGAGDLWAAGFLFGLVNGYPLEKCGQLGSACGYEVCQVIGASIPEEGWDRIKKLLV